MGTIRSVGAGAGVRWLVDAFNIGRRNAGAVFGGAGWLLAVGVIAGGACVGANIAFGLQASARSPLAAFAIGLLVMLPMVLVMAFPTIGYLRLIDAAESGRPARASDVLAGFRDGATGGRIFMAIILVAIVQEGLMVGLVALLAPDVGHWYAQALHAGALGSGAPKPASLPDGFWTAYGILILLSVFAYALQAIFVPQIALAGRSVGGALRDAAEGIIRNPLPILVFALTAAGASIVLVICVVLIVLLLALVAAASSPWVAVVAGVLLYLAAMLVMVAIVFGSMYYVWRDIAGGGADKRMHAAAVAA